MKRNNLFWAVSLAGVLLCARAQAQEQPGQLGVGVYLGTPFGFSGKYLIDSNLAFASAVGVQGDDLDLHFDLINHFRDVDSRFQPREGRFAPYLGLGIKLKDQKDTLFGFRFVGGVAFVFPRAPIELFGEIAPVLRLAPSAGSNFDGGAGLRYYFGGSRSSYSGSRYR